MSVLRPGQRPESLPPSGEVIGEMTRDRRAAEDRALWERIVLSLVAGKCYTDDDINTDNLAKDAADTMAVIKAGPPKETR